MNDALGSRPNLPEPDDDGPPDVSAAPDPRDRRDAFICHCDATDREEARLLVEKLEHRGVTCWTARRDARGREIDVASHAGVTSCPWTIVLFSRKAIEKTKYMRRELAIATKTKQEVRFIPVIHDIGPGKALDDDPRFGKFDFYVSNANKIYAPRFDDDGCVDEIVSRIKEKPARALPFGDVTSDPAEPGVPRSAPAVPRSRPGALRAVAIVALLAAIVTFATIYVFRPWWQGAAERHSSTEGNGPRDASPKPSVDRPALDDATVPTTLLVAEGTDAAVEGALAVELAISWPSVPAGWSVAVVDPTVVGTEAPERLLPARSVAGAAGRWTVELPIADDPKPQSIAITLVATPGLKLPASQLDGATPVRVARGVKALHLPKLRATGFARPPFDLAAAGDAAAAVAAAKQLDQWLLQLPTTIAATTSGWELPKDVVERLRDAVASDAKRATDAARSWLAAVAATRLRLSRTSVAYNLQSRPAVVDARSVEPAGDADLSPFTPASLFSLVPSTAGAAPLVANAPASPGIAASFEIPLPAADGTTSYQLTRCDGVAMEAEGGLTVTRDSQPPTVRFVLHREPRDSWCIDPARAGPRSLPVVLALSESGELIVTRLRPPATDGKSEVVARVPVTDLDETTEVALPLPARASFDATDTGRLDFEFAVSAKDASGNESKEPLRRSIVVVDAAVARTHALAEIDAIRDAKSLAQWEQLWKGELARLPSAIRDEIEVAVGRNDYAERARLGLVAFERSDKASLTFGSATARFWNLRLPAPAGTLPAIEFVELAGGPTTLEPDARSPHAGLRREYYRNVPRYLIATHETTCRLLDAFLDSPTCPTGIARPRSRGVQESSAPEQPAVGVPFATARAFADWLDQVFGFPRGPGGFDLPDEFEWRHACADLPARLAADPAALLQSAAAYGALDSPHAVGTHAANAFGVHDLLGNASEWCEDVLVEVPERDTLLHLYYGRADSPVLRGGCYRVPEAQAAAQLNCHVRGWAQPDEEAWAGAGFRIVFHPVVQ